MSRLKRLVLGTAQWGLDYGVTNISGRLTDDSITLILQTAKSAGFDLLDTAPGYGDAEGRVGTLASTWPVQTKVNGSSDVRQGVEKSIAVLGRVPERVLVHDWPTLSDDRRRVVAQELEEMRTSGAIGMVGISGYEEADVRSALVAFQRLDLAQMPTSVLDQRLDGSSAVDELRAAGGLLQARSVYLQGLALSAPGTGPLADHPQLSRLRAACAEAGVDVGTACRSFVLGQDWIDEVVVGVADAGELLPWGEGGSAPQLTWASLASDDVSLLDPRTWPEAGQGG